MFDRIFLQENERDTAKIPFILHAFPLGVCDEIYERICPNTL